MSVLASTRGGSARRQAVWAGVPATNSFHRSSTSAVSESAIPCVSTARGHGEIDTKSEGARAPAGSARATTRTAATAGRIRTAFTVEVIDRSTRVTKAINSEVTSHSAAETLENGLLAQ